MSTNYRYLHAWLYAMLFILFLLIVPRAGFDFDVDSWTRWAIYIQEKGLRNAYEQADNNYNPLYHYVLWAYAKLMGNAEHVERYKHMLKAFTLLFDFAGAILVAALATPDRERRFLLSLVLLFNIGYLYNTLLWEQVDAIFTCLVAGAVLLALRNRLTLSVLVYVLAFNAKTQAIIFLPPLLLLWLPLARPRGLLVWRPLVAATALQLLLLLPFLWLAEQNAWPRLVDINLHAADMYPFITMNAHNLWAFISPYGMMPLVSTLDDTTIGAAGLTYRQWGMVLFLIASTITLLPLLLLSLHAFWHRQLTRTRQEQALILLSCASIPLLFTYFNTQMHERYWHAAILFLAGYGFLTGRYWLLVLVSVAYTLQLESLLRFWQLKNYGTLLFNDMFNAALFTISIIGAIAEIYRVTPVRRLWNELFATQQLRPVKKAENSSYLPPSR